MTQAPDAAPRPLPKAGEAAFFLDFDGTLVDIAPTPEGVHVPSDLCGILMRLRGMLGDALAVVSGRPVDEVDSYLPGVPYAVAGEHGVAIRHAPQGSIMRAEVPQVPSEWLQHSEQLAQANPGVRVERKIAGFVLHYRGNPAAGNTLEQAARTMVAGSEGRFHVQASKMAWEIRAAGIDKGGAVRMLMQQAPFEGRLPVFIGDDVTDEDGIRAAQTLGGVGYRIPDDFDDPTAVRAWLALLADGEARAWAV